MAYSPDQRQVTCQILTRAGWMSGTYHMLRVGKFLEQLNVPGEFHKITDATFAGKNTLLPFFALQREAITMVIPPPNESDLVIEGTEELTAHKVFVLFEQGFVEGTMMIRKNVRISDYLVKQAGFVLLRRCTLKLGSLQDEFFAEEKHPAIAINAKQIVGVSDTSPFT